jgi:hypothetical protein
VAERLIPATQDRDTAGFFAAAAEGRLAIRVCLDCQHAIHPPMAHCPKCGSWNTDWRTSEGRGTLYSWTTVTHQIHPAYPTPYTVVVVSVDDAPGVRLIGSLPGAPALHAGQPMRVWFEILDQGVVIPQWAPEASATA